MLRRYPLTHSIANFGFRHASTNTSYYPPQDKTEEMRRLRSVLQHCMEHKKPNGVSQTELAALIETFEIAGAMSMHNGDTVKGHLYQDCATACQILRELDKSANTVSDMKEKAHASVAYFVPTYLLQITLPSTLTTSLMVGMAAYAIGTTSQQKKMSIAHETLYAKHHEALETTNQRLVAEMVDAAHTRSAGLKN